MFVTGANGFIGRNFIEYAAQKGCEIYAVSRKSIKFKNNKKIKLLIGNFNDNWINQIKKCIDSNWSRYDGMEYEHRNRKDYFRVNF